MNARIFSLISLVLLGIIIATVQYYASEFSWYWRWWWLDIIMHTLGGAFMAYLFLWSHLSLSKGKLPKPLITVSVVLVIGILWEVFESVMGATYVYFESYPVDTAMDIFFDICGAVAVAYILLRPSAEIQNIQQKT